MTNLAELGPLGVLAGVWQGERGEDIAPDNDRMVAAKSFYRETMSFEPIGQVNNHDQCLFGLRYANMVWPVGEKEPYHEEVGYWLWDDCNQQAMKCFSVPRGYTVVAGGTVEPSAKTIEVQAEAGSECYGLLSNQFLLDEFKTIRYELRIDVHNDDCFSYSQDTVLQIKGQSELFHHTDMNKLQRVE